MKASAPKFIIPIVVLLAVIAALVLLWALNRPEQEPPLAEVKSCVGLITKIAQDSFIIKAEANKNYSEQDMDLTVVVNSATQYSKLTMPAIVPNDVEDISGLIKEEISRFSDLKIGDEVVVVSEENIRGKDSFTALSIQVTAGDAVLETAGEAEVDW